MKPHNFEALARLAGLRIGSASYRGACAHLIDGASQAQAAAQLGIKPQTVSAAVGRILRAELLALRALRE